jgi:hypothetical protein
MMGKEYHTGIFCQAGIDLMIVNRELPGLFAELWVDKGHQG